MSVPVRLQLSRKKGFNLQAHSIAQNGLSAVNCARPSKWGNPFTKKSGEDIGFSFTNRELVNFFKWWISGDRSNWIGKESDVSCAKITENIEDLRGKNLACWCDLDGSCHVDILLEIANRPLRPVGK